MLKWCRLNFIMNKKHSTSFNNSMPYPSVAEITEELKDIGYVSETWDLQWMEEVLTKSGASRCHLLKWCLHQFGIASVKNSDIKQHFDSLGLFSREGDCITGSAPSSMQQRFWFKLIQAIRKVKALKYQDADKALYSLCDSRGPLHLSEGKDLFFLPADLAKLYKKCQDTEIKLEDSPITDIPQTRETNDIESVIVALSSLNNTNKHFSDIYKARFDPWCTDHPQPKNESLSANIQKNLPYTTMFSSTLQQAEDLNSLAKEVQSCCLQEEIKSTASTVLNSICKE